MGKILVVDDIIAWTEFHKTNLIYAGAKEEDIDIATSAFEASNLILDNLDNPYKFIFTDLQMESNYLPLTAGEWLIKYIKTYPEYNNTKIIIISASANIAQIAKKNDVEYLSKYNARNSDSLVYKEFLEY